MNTMTAASNLLGKYFAYLKRDLRVKGLPTRLWIEPTPSCNFKCGHCPNGMDVKYPTGLMKMDLFTSLVDQLAGTGAEVNLFHRGESLIHPKLALMVEQCAARGLKTRLHTNAGLLTKEKSRALIAAGLNYISFSVDGYTREVYSRVRLGGDFDETVVNIRDFLHIKSEHGGEKPFSVIQVMEIGEEAPGKGERRRAFRKLFEGLPLDRFVVRTPHNWAGDADTFGHGIAATGQRRFTPCTFLWYSMTIFFDGTVAPCPQDFFGKINIGDVSKDTLANVWNNEAMREMRRRMKVQDVTGLNPCETCDMLTRKTFMGVPRNYLATFLKDNLLIR